MTGISLRELLESLTATDLRFLCGMFRLQRGGSKDDLVERLMDSGYTAREIHDPASEIVFGALVEDFVPKSVWAEILSAHGLASSGSRHELLLSLVENRLLDPRGVLEAINPSQLREVYYALFDRVPTAGPAVSIGEILNVFGFGEASTEARPARKRRLRSASFDYDIALSFAGEDRSIARQIADQLRSKGVRVFLDEYETTKLWGRNLSDELRSRYGEKTKYVVLLVSSHYAVKDWTDFEFTVAKREAGRRKHEFILPVRLDDTPLPGLRSGIAYLTLEEYGVGGIVREILGKLDLNGD